MRLRTRSLLAPILGAAAIFASTSPADACGGFFCSQAQPVNQAAERIIFADNGDGTVTAVIQILYDGPSENFSWLLPISSVPMGDEIGVASDLAFQRLQGATNPRYTLTVRIEGTCRQDGLGTGGTVANGGTGGTSVIGPSAGAGGSGGGVTVEASGVVGAFEWTVISLDSSLSNPADVAVTWLGDNGYDVPDGAPGLIGPYLEDGLYLLALRLTKGATTGSIRPIVLSYEASRPMIPVKLTAVAANEDMGVMTWVLGAARAVPQNYLSLELNEARVNWFNAQSTYNDVVTAAANEGDGRGFVTELSAPASTLQNVVWTANDAASWEYFQSGAFQSFQQMFDRSYAFWASWDGYWDAVESSVTLPDDVSFDDFKLCPSCYSAQVDFAPSEFLAALESEVIEPVQRVQTLIDAHQKVTRFYTTMSAEEMIVDPLFTFNPDLPDVSNVHTAERIIECNPNVYQWEAPWRIELPQGGVVRGVGNPTGTWPEALSDMPSNYRILRHGETGEGRVLEDNGEVISTSLDEYNGSVPIPPSGGMGGASNGGAPSGGSNASGGRTATGGSGNGGSLGGTGGARNPAQGESRSSRDSGGCSVASGDSSVGAGLLALFVAALRRRRRPSAR